MNAEIVKHSLAPYMLKLEPYLQRMERGRFFDPSMCMEITGQPYKRLCSSIQAWFIRRGIATEMRDGQLYLLTEWEQVSVRPEKRIRKAARQMKKSHVEVGLVDPRSLTQHQMEIQEHVQDVNHRILGALVGARREIGFTLAPPAKRTGQDR